MVFSCAFLVTYSAYGIFNRVELFILAKTHLVRVRHRALLKSPPLKGKKTKQKRGATYPATAVPRVQLGNGQFGIRLVCSGSLHARTQETCPIGGSGYGGGAPFRFCLLRVVT